MDYQPGCLELNKARYSTQLSNRLLGLTVIGDDEKMQETKVAINKLLDRSPEMSLADQDITWSGTPVVHGVERLLVDFNESEILAVVTAGIPVTERNGLDFMLGINARLSKL